MTRRPRRYSLISNRNYFALLAFGLTQAARNANYGPDGNAIVALAAGVALIWYWVETVLEDRDRERRGITWTMREDEP